MNITRIEGSYPSVGGRADIHYYGITPEQPRAVVQFLHGMAEHSERYLPFGEFLAQNGIAFYMADHLGHGKSITANSELGYFGKGGWRHLAADAAALTTIIRSRHPDTPLVIGGHSMGSFVCRAYLALFPELPDAAIIMGTGRATAVVSAGRLLAGAVGMVKGDHYRSLLLNKLSFDSYNDRIKSPSTPFDWLSVNADNVARYVEDDFCGFVFTADGFVNVAAMMGFVTGKKWAKKVRQTLPILLVSGREDPVGNYGKAVWQTAVDLHQTGHERVRLKLYDGMRHEILNETDHETVYRDLLVWMEEVLA